VPPDYQGYCARDQRLAAGPYPGEPTPREVRDGGEQFCVGTPAECIRFIELYEALGIEEMILLCAVGPAGHEEVFDTLRLFSEQGIPHFRAVDRSDFFAFMESADTEAKLLSHCADPSVYGMGRLACSCKSGKGPIMVRLLVGCILSFYVVSASAADLSCTAQTTEKKLAGAAKTSFMNKCERHARTSCEAAAGEKKLAGAARTSFSNKCVKDAVGG